jgi:hypothetical protein
LGIVLWQAKELPGFLRWPGLGYALWGALAPFMQLPMGDELELHYNLWQQVVVNVGVFAGVLLLAGAAATALGPWGRARRTLP